MTGLDEFCRIKVNRENGARLNSTETGNAVPPW